ncbi:MAG: hypothetical protein LBE15_02865 [Burkholderiales bacterium]|nr:hypothetical protein [Burkholderiales bacterium]
MTLTSQGAANNSGEAQTSAASPRKTGFARLRHVERLRWRRTPHIPSRKSRMLDVK